MSASEQFKEITDAWKTTIIEAAYLAMEDTINAIFDEVYKYLSLPAHSAKELRKLGYPFAARHGTIQPHGHEPKEGIHRGEGEDIRTDFIKRIERISDNYILGSVGWIDNVLELVEWLIYGTYKMLPRPIFDILKIDIEKTFKENFNKRLYWVAA